MNLRFIYILCVCWLSCSAVSAQIAFELQLLPDNETYQISMTPDTTYVFPFNLTSSGQVTIRVPHGTGDYRFETQDFQTLVAETQWDQNTRIDAPLEAPNWDYVSFGLISLGTDKYDYQTDVEIPIFSFKNGGIACVDSIELINLSDPFYPPNSQSANIGNSISILGAGLVNAYTANIGTGRELCTPEPMCEVSSENEADICVGELYEGQSFLRDTIYETNHITPLGCDSTARHEVRVHADQLDMQQISLCTGEEYEGQMFARDTTLRTDFSSQFGCDSVIIAQITISPTYDEQIEVTIPSGATYEGVIYDMDERVILNLMTSAGCDSTVTVQIRVIDVPTISEDVNLCSNESYNGVFYNQTTSVFDTIFTDNGTIDTILIANIFVSDSYAIERDTMLCGSETFNGQTYTENTVVIEELKTTAGCDSTITTNITVAESEEDILFVSVCERVPYEGVVYARDTSFTNIFTSQSGCDSVVTRNINVLENPPIPLPTEMVLCDLNELPLELDAGDYVSYQWSTGSNSPQITVNQLGDYFVRVTNNRGCQDSVTVDIRLAELSATTEVLREGCEKDALQTLAINAQATELPILYSIDGGETFDTESTFAGLEVGTYDVVVEDLAGCQVNRQIKLQPKDDVIVILPEALYIDLGDSVEIKARTNATTIDSIIWSPATDLSCTDCLRPVASPFLNQIYQLTLNLGEGCSVTQEVVVYVDRTPKFYAPNIFSPNSDGENDLFTIYPGINIAAVRDFRIFSRWGDLVYERSLVEPTERASHWDGKVGGRRAPAGTYVYTAMIELLNGQTQIIEGEITLAR
ncbi:MAG: gliding motility-associated C-terminal domain-containing protein [Saprospiraceae bacterium]